MSNDRHELYQTVELLAALRGMVGLVQLICRRHDVSRELREAIALNHRYVDAEALIERCDNASADLMRDVPVRES